MPVVYLLSILFSVFLTVSAEQAKEEKPLATDQKKQSSNTAHIKKSKKVKHIVKQPNNPGIKKILARNNM